MIHERKMNRRHFLKTVGTTAAGAIAASAFPTSLGQTAQAYSGSQEEKQYDFLMARVRYESDRRAPNYWNIYPGADLNLLRELTSVIRCKVKLPQRCNNDTPMLGRNDQFNGVIDFDNPETYPRFPFAFMTGESHYELTDPQKENLKKYLTGGGFLFMDDCVFSDGMGGDFFYQSSYKALEETFGKGSVVRIPRSHEVFHNVFDFGEEGVPYMQGQNYGAHGLFIDDRLAVFLCPSDLHCGWTFPSFFGQEKYKQSLQMGINIIMYAMSH